MTYTYTQNQDEEIIKFEKMIAEIDLDVATRRLNEIKSYMTDARDRYLEDKQTYIADSSNRVYLQELLTQAQKAQDKIDKANQVLAV